MLAGKQSELESLRAIKTTKYYLVVCKLPMGEVAQLCQPSCLDVAYQICLDLVDDQHETNFTPLQLQGLDFKQSGLTRTSHTPFMWLHIAIQYWSPYSESHCIEHLTSGITVLTEPSLNLPGLTVALIMKGARYSSLLALHFACGAGLGFHEDFQKLHFW